MPVDMSGNIFGLMDVMEMLELSISEFYAQCSKRWSINEDFWLKLSQEEQKHAAYIREMVKFIKAEPGKFKPGRAFNLQAVHTVRQGVLSNIERVKGGQMAEPAALSISRDIEQSLIERNYAEVVISQHAEYNKLVEQIVKDTLEHRLRINKRITGV